MNGRFAAICVLSLTGLLSGCVQYKWVKPGVSDTEMNKKLTECEAQALIEELEVREARVLAMEARLGLNPQAPCSNDPDKA